MNRIPLVLVFAMLTSPLWAAETCTTQSAMAPAERASLAEAARAIATAVQSNDVATLRATSTPEIQQNFGALQYIVATTSPKLAGATPRVEQLYLLDASTSKPSTDPNSEAQFFCSLNKTTQEVDFSIPGLPPARYGFAIVDIQSHPAPWRISLLLRQDASGKWLITGFYPKQLTLAGHDGLWYWSQARTYAQNKQPWDAWLFYQAAQTLLRPADFLLSTHLEKLRNESAAAAPPALSEGISPQTPLVVKAAGTAPVPAPAKTNSGTASAPEAPTDFRFTSLSLADPPNPGSVSPMLSVHLRADALSDPTAARQRNVEAARALLAAYPELRKPFENISVTAESPNQPPLTTVLPLADLK
jgi:hypothetical protein